MIHGVPNQLSEIREHFIRNLTPYTVYSFKVRERTAAGWGPFTNRIQAVTLEGGQSCFGVEISILRFCVPKHLIF